jgi:hypothetical protein
MKNKSVVLILLTFTLVKNTMAHPGHSFTQSGIGHDLSYADHLIPGIALCLAFIVLMNLLPKIVVTLKFSKRIKGSRMSPIRFLRRASFRK